MTDPAEITDLVLPCAFGASCRFYTPSLHQLLPSAVRQIRSLLLLKPMSFVLYRCLRPSTDVSWVKVSSSRDFEHRVFGGAWQGSRRWRGAGERGRRGIAKPKGARVPAWGISVKNVLELGDPMRLRQS